MKAFFASFYNSIAAFFSNWLFYRLALSQIKLGWTQRRPIIPPLIISETEDESMYCSTTSSDNEDSAMNLARVIYKLEASAQSPGHLLLITPAAPQHCPSDQFRLHILDSSARLLSVTHVESDMLSLLLKNDAFQRHNSVIASRFINIEDVAEKSAFLSHSLGLLQGKPECLEVKPVLVDAATDPCNELTTPFSLTSLHESEILRLIECINNTAGRHRKRDICRFFQLADRYGFELYVRPHMLDKAIPWSPDYKTHGQPHRFILEAFLPYGGHIGGIMLYEQQLLRRLAKQRRVLLRLHIIDDAFELTPLPSCIRLVLCFVCQWTGLEMIYNVLGELLFAKYKTFLRP